MKAFLTIIIVIAVICNVAAQHSVGLYAGPTLQHFTDLSRVNEYGETINQREGGFIAAVFHKLKHDERLSFQTEIAWKQQEANVEFILSDAGHSNYYSISNHQFNQLSASFLAALKVIRVSAVTAHIQFGPSASLIVSGSSHHENGSFYYVEGMPGGNPSLQWMETNYDAAIVDNFRRFNFGLTAGVSFNVALNNKIDLLLLNRYIYMQLMNKESDPRHLKLLTGFIGVGVNYKLISMN